MWGNQVKFIRAFNQGEIYIEIYEESAATVLNFRAKSFILPNNEAVI